MIELERHIEILLLSNDCVIVPDFGGFMAHHIDARYSQNDNLFLPPLRTIGFNPQLKLNDSVLAQSYIEAHDISYPEAMQKIETDVTELRKELETNGSYQMNDIGKIILTDNGRYEFEPCEAGLLTPALYGLNSFEFKTLAQKKEEQQALEEALTIQNSTMPASTDNDDTKQSKNSASVGFIPSQKSNIFPGYEEDGEDKKAITIPLSWIRNVAVAVIAIIAFILMPSPLSNNAKNIAGSALDTNLLYQIMPKNVTTGDSNIDLRNTNLTKSEAQPNNHETKKSTLNKKISQGENKLSLKNNSCEAPYYCVVLSSKVSLRNANNYVSRLHEQGYKESAVINKGRNSKVVYGKYKTKNEANAIMNKLNNSSDFSDCWVTRIRQ